MEQRKEAPAYLRNEEMYKDFIVKDYQVENPAIKQ